MVERSLYPLPDATVLPSMIAPRPRKRSPRIFSCHRGIVRLRRCRRDISERGPRIQGPVDRSAAIAHLRNRADILDAVCRIGDAVIYGGRFWSGDQFMRMWMMTFFLLVTATTGAWADMTVSTFEQKLIPHAPTDQVRGLKAHGTAAVSQVRRVPQIAVSLAYQLDHGWVVMSAGSVARNTLLD